MPSHVLIVEDEWLIAEDLRGDLEERGYGVLGPVPSCEEAMNILRSGEVNLAVVDTELSDGTCETVLEECDRLGVPVIIFTGHSEAPPYAATRPMLGKPHQQSSLDRALDEIWLGR